MTESLDVAVLASELFESLSIPHFVGGSVASTYYSEWRTTNDVDIAVAMKPAHVDGFVTRALSHFLVEPEFVREGVRERRMFTMVHRQTYMKVDVYVCELAGFFQSQHERARHARIRTTPIGEARIQTCEDVVLQKLRWYQQGDCMSDRQWRDIISVLKIWHERVDHGYLDSWASRLGVSELLISALREARGTGDT